MICYAKTEEIKMTSADTNKGERCPLCFSFSIQAKFKAKTLDYSQDRFYEILQCDKCGHALTLFDERNHESDCQCLYSSGNYDVKEKFWHKLLFPFRINLERNKLKYLEGANFQKRCLLEIGCGKGKFLEVARRKGMEVYGIEPSLRSYAYASVRLGNVVYPLKIEELDKINDNGERYGIIVLWHVLEHLKDLDNVLRIIKNHKDEHGIILIAVPNVSSFQSQIGREDWYHLDPPRHLHHFTPKSLNILVQRHGLEIKRIYFNSFYQNYIGEMITFLNKILPDKNVIFNCLRLNKNYLKRFSKVRILGMFMISVVISAIIFIPVIVWTLYTQIKRKAGTMVILAK